MEMMPKDKKKVMLLTVLLLLGSMVYVSLTFGSVQGFLGNEYTFNRVSPEEDSLLANRDNIISALENIKATEKIAEIGNTDILVKDVIVGYLKNRAYGRQHTLRDAVNERVTGELLFLEAEKRGLTVSYEEAKEYMNWTREKLEKNETFRELLKMSLVFYSSEDEYWEASIPDYQKGLAIANLKEEIDNKEQFEALGKKLLTDAIKEAKVTYMPAVEQRLEIMPKLQAIRFSKD